MKVVSTEALTKLIQLIKSSFISVDDTEQTSEIETETPNEVTLATVATTGDYDDLINKPTAEDVGALPVTGGTMTGEILSDSDIKVKYDDNLYTDISHAQIYMKNENYESYYEADQMNLYNPHSQIYLSDGTIRAEYSDNDTYHFLELSSGVLRIEVSNTVGEVYNVTLDPSNGYFEIPTPKDNYSDVANEAAINAEWLKTYAMPLKQDVLVSGTNIKTINNQSLLGSGNIDSYHPDLLSFQWSDHLLNNVSWLRADTFSWQDGTVYEAAYEHLTNDITGVTPTTETVGSNTITVYVASDGHKIVLADQAQTVQDIYDETGVAWYFILDTTNQRFKLPRTKFGFTGLRDSVGKFVEAGLPNITGTQVFDTYGAAKGASSGAFTNSKSNSYANCDGGGGAYGNSTDLVFDASLSNSIYGNSTTVQPPATEMYLYFYVGDYTQTALEQTAGLNAELFNGKLDISTFNETPHIVETYINGTSWYRIWSDKWCEQGGQSSLIADYGTATIILLKEFSNTDYTITKATMIPSNGDDTSYNDATCIRYATKTTNSFQIYNRGAADGGRYVAWQACGYIS